jgi:hypothetical protein
MKRGLVTITRSQSWDSPLQRQLAVQQIAYCFLLIKIFRHLCATYTGADDELAPRAQLQNWRCSKLERF